MHFIKSNRGIAIGIVLFVITILGMFIFFTHKRATQDRHSMHKSMNRYVSKLAAESILAISSSSIVESKKSEKFSNRWYKMLNFRSQNKVAEKQGYIGKLEGKINILSGLKDISIPYLVIGEDVPGPGKKRLSTTPGAKELHQYAASIKYYRPDLFARVEYGSEKLVLYSPLVVHPEENIYTIHTKKIQDPNDPNKIIVESNVDQVNLR